MAFDESTATAVQDETQKPAFDPASAQPVQESSGLGGFTKGVGSAVVGAVKGLIPTSGEQLAEMATPLVSGLKEVTETGRKLADVAFGGKTVAEEFPAGKPFTEFTAREAGQFAGEIGVNLAMAALIKKGLRLSDVVGIPKPEIEPAPLSTEAAETAARTEVRPDATKPDSQASALPTERQQPVVQETAGDTQKGDTRETPAQTPVQEVAPVPQPEHPLQGQIYYRGEHPQQRGGDTFYSADRTTAEEYSAHGEVPTAGQVTETKGESLPSKIYEATNKEQLAEELGIKGKTYGFDFDKNVKNKLQSQGYEGVRYSEGTSLGEEIQTPQEEVHVFGKPTEGGAGEKVQKQVEGQGKAVLAEPAAAPVQSEPAAETIASTAVKVGEEQPKTGTSWNQSHAEIDPNAPESAKGFVTSTGRFVGREEGATIAKESGQVAATHEGPLHSENLIEPAAAPETTAGVPSVEAMTKPLSPTGGPSIAAMAERPIKLPEAGTPVGWAESTAHGHDWLDKGGNIEEVLNTFRTTGKVDPWDIGKGSAYLERLQAKTNAAGDALDRSPSNPQRQTAFSEALKNEQTFSDTFKPMATVASNSLKGFQGKRPLTPEMALSSTGLTRKFIENLRRDPTTEEATKVRQLSEKNKAASQDRIDKTNELYKEADKAHGKTTGKVTVQDLVKMFSEPLKEVCDI